MDPNFRGRQEDDSRYTDTSNFDPPIPITSTTSQWTNANEHTSQSTTTVPVSSGYMLPCSGTYQNSPESQYPSRGLQAAGTDVALDTSYIMAPPQWDEDWESWDSGNASEPSPYQTGLSPQGQIGSPGSSSSQHENYLSPMSQQRPLPSWAQLNLDPPRQPPWGSNSTQQYFEQTQYNTLQGSPSQSSSNSTHAQADQRLAQHLSDMNTDFSFTSTSPSTLTTSSRRPANRQQRLSNSNASSSKSKSSSSKRTPPSPSTKPSSSQRQTHNAIEKQYRIRLNNHFANLLAKIPPKYLPLLPDNAPTSKAETLVLAEHYIKVLEKEGQDLTASNKELIEDLEALKREWDRAGGWVGSPPPPRSRGGPMP